MNFVKIIQVIVSVILVILVLIQSKGTGLASGLKSSFGAYRSLRGVEKIVFYATIFFGVLLVINSLLILILSA